VLNSIYIYTAYQDEPHGILTAWAIVKYLQTKESA